MITFWVVLFDIAWLVVAYQQNDYIAITERADVVNYDNPYGAGYTNFFKFNRTYTALNMTLVLKRNLEHDFMVDVQAYRFASNEYRLFPLAFTMDFCKTLYDNTFGIQNFYSCGNFTACPLKKGTHRICNWGPDYAKFPPYIPHGQYRLDHNCKHNSTLIFTARWYLKIVGVKQF